MTIAAVKGENRKGRIDNGLDEGKGCLVIVTVWEGILGNSLGMGKDAW